MQNLIILAAAEGETEGGHAPENPLGFVPVEFALSLVIFGLLLFLIWHLLEFTIVKISVNPDAQGADVVNNPYRLVEASFQVPWLTIVYVLAMGALALHLAHGTFSAQQTLGWTGTPAAYKRAKAIGYTLATVIAVGFIIPPLAILFGLI